MSRTRIFEDSHTTPEGVFTHYNANGSVKYVILRNGDDWISDVLTDVEIPNFHKRSKNGELFFNPYDRKTENYSETLGSWTASGVNGEYWVCTGACTSLATQIWPFPTFTILGDEEIPDMISRTQQRALARVDASDFSFGEDVAELKKTILAIRRILADIANILTRFHQLVAKLRKKGYSDLDAFSTLWLRARYEIRPLVISIQNIIEIYQSGLKKYKTRRKARSGDSMHKDTTQTLVTETSSNKFTWTFKQSLNVKTSAGIIYDDSDPIDSPLEQLGLSVKDFVPTLWAITRFSFLIDRFIDIASTLEGIQNIWDPNIKIKGGWTTVTREYTSELTLDSVTMNNGDWTYNVSGGAKRMVSSHKSRIPFNPTISTVIPTWDLSLDVETFLDLFTIFREKDHSTLRT